jgi:hypothetical protein
MTEIDALPFDKLACWRFVKPAKHPKDFGSERVLQPAIVGSKPSMPLKINLV